MLSVSDIKRPPGHCSSSTTINTTTTTAAAHCFAGLPVPNLSLRLPLAPGMEVYTMGPYAALAIGALRFAVRHSTSYTHTTATTTKSLLAPLSTTINKTHKPDNRPQCRQPGRGHGRLPHHR